MKSFKRILSIILALILMLGAFLPSISASEVNKPAYSLSISARPKILDVLLKQKSENKHSLRFSDNRALTELENIDLENLELPNSHSKLLKNLEALEDRLNIFNQSDEEGKAAEEESSLLEEKSVDKPSEEQENQEKIEESSELEEEEQGVEDKTVEEKDFLEELEEDKEDQTLEDKDFEETFEDIEEILENLEKEDDPEEDNPEEDELTEEEEAEEEKELFAAGLEAFKKPILENGKLGEVYTLDFEDHPALTQLEYQINRDQSGKAVSISWIYKIYSTEKTPEIYNAFITYPDEGLGSAKIINEELSEEDKKENDDLRELRESFLSDKKRKELLTKYEKSASLQYKVEHLSPSENGYYYSKIITPIHDSKNIKDKQENSSSSEGWTLDIVSRMGSESRLQRFRLNKEGQLLWPKDGADKDDFAPQIRANFSEDFQRVSQPFANSGSKELSYRPELKLEDPKQLENAQLIIYELKNPHIEKEDIKFSILTKKLEAFDKEDKQAKETIIKELDYLFKDSAKGMTISPVGQYSLKDYQGKKAIKLQPGQLALSSVFISNSEEKTPAKLPKGRDLNLKLKARGNPEADKTNIDGEIIWKAEKSADRPDSVEVELLKNGKAFSPAKTQLVHKRGNGEKAWSYHFDDLPRIDKDTKMPIFYSVRLSNPIKGYYSGPSLELKEGPCNLILFCLNRDESQSALKASKDTAAFSLINLDEKDRPLEGAKFRLEKIDKNTINNKEEESFVKESDEKKSSEEGLTGLKDKIRQLFRSNTKEDTKEVHKKDETSQKERFIVEKEVASTGSITFEGLKDGNYELKEIKAPSDEEIKDKDGKVIQKIHYEPNSELYKITVKDGEISIDGKAYGLKNEDKDSLKKEAAEVKIRSLMAKAPVAGSAEETFESPEAFLTKKISPINQKEEGQKKNKYQVHLKLEGKTSFNEGRAVDMVILVDHSDTPVQNKDTAQLNEEVNKIVSQLKGFSNLKLGYVEYSGKNENTKIDFEPGTESVISSLELMTPEEMLSNEKFNTKTFGGANFIQDGLIKAKSILDEGREDADKKILLISESLPNLSYQVTDYANDKSLPDFGMEEELQEKSYDSYGTAFSSNVLGDGVHYRFTDAKKEEKLDYDFYNIPADAIKKEDLDPRVKEIHDNGYSTMSYLDGLNEGGVEITTLTFGSSELTKENKEKILSHMASPGRFKDAQDLSQVSSAFADLYGLSEEKAIPSIKKGQLIDHLGKSLTMDLGADQKLDESDYELKFSIPELAEGTKLHYDEKSHDIVLSGLNLKAGQWLQLNYSVFMEEESDENSTLLLDGTTLKPNASDSDLIRTFPNTFFIYPAMTKTPGELPAFIVTNAISDNLPIYKVDAEDDSRYLAGAQFRLEKEGDEPGNYEPVTDMDSIFSLTSGRIPISLNDLAEKLGTAPREESDPLTDEEKALVKGRYRLHEINASAGYEDPEGPEAITNFTIVENDLGDLVLGNAENIPLEGNLLIKNTAISAKGELQIEKLHKLLSDEGNPQAERVDKALAGAEFTLVPLKDDGSLDGEGIKKTSLADLDENNANLIFDNIEPGTYRLKETGAPDGFVCPEGTWKITVDEVGLTTIESQFTRSQERDALLPDGTEPYEMESGYSAHLKLYNHKPYIIFSKYDGLNYPLMGGKFVLKKLTAEGEEEIQSIPADNGQLIFEDLEKGQGEDTIEYKVYETEPPEGGFLAAEGPVASFKVDKDGKLLDINPQSRIIYNKFGMVRVYLKKIDATSAEPLNGAEFNLYKRIINKLPENFVPAGDGTLNLGKLSKNPERPGWGEEGKYNLIDKDNQMLASFTVKVDENGKPELSSWDSKYPVNTDSEGNVIIQELPLAEYALNIETEKKMNKSPFISETLDGQKGIINLSYLEPATYFLEETKLPTGEEYHAPLTRTVILVQPNGEVQVNGADTAVTKVSPGEVLNFREKTGALGALKISRGSGGEIDAVSGATYAVWQSTDDLDNAAGEHKNIFAPEDGTIDWEYVEKPQRYVPFEKEHDPNTKESDFYKRYGFLLGLKEKEMVGSEEKAVYYRIQEGRAPMGYQGKSTGAFIVKMLDDPNDPTKRLVPEWIRLYDENGNFVENIYQHGDPLDTIRHGEEDKIILPDGSLIGLTLDLDEDPEAADADLIPSLLVDNQPNELNLLKYDPSKLDESEGHIADQESATIPQEALLEGAEFAVYYRDELVGLPFKIGEETIRLSPVVKNELGSGWLAPSYGAPMDPGPNGENQYRVESDANGLVHFEKLPQRFIKYRTVNHEEDWPNTLPAFNVRPHYYIVETKAPAGSKRLANPIGPFIATENGFLTIDKGDTVKAKDGKEMKAVRQYKIGSQEDPLSAFAVPNSKYTVEFRKLFEDYKKNLKPMPGVSFRLYRMDESGKYQPVSFAEDGEAIYHPDEPEKALTVKSRVTGQGGLGAAQGDFSFKIPKEGNYAVKEVTPDYYQDLGFVRIFTRDKDGNVSVLKDNYVEYDEGLRVQRQSRANMAGGISFTDYRNKTFSSIFYVNPQERSHTNPIFHIYLPNSEKANYSVELYEMPEGISPDGRTYPRNPDQPLTAMNQPGIELDDSRNNELAIIFTDQNNTNHLDRKGCIVKVIGPFDPDANKVSIDASFSYERSWTRTIHVSIFEEKALQEGITPQAGEIDEIINRSSLDFTLVDGGSDDPTYPYEGQRLSGGTFVLQKKDKDGIYQTLTDYPSFDGDDHTFVTGKNGRIHLEALAAGEYKLIETKVPVEYSQNSKAIRSFSVSENGEITPDSPPGDQDFKILENLREGDVSLKIKKFDEKGELLPGAFIKLRPIHGSGQIKETDAQGTIAFDSLPTGNYWLTETKAPEGYVLDSTNHWLTLRPQAATKYSAPRDESTGQIKAGKNVGEYIEIQHLSVQTSNGSTKIIYPNQADSLGAKIQLHVKEPSKIKPGDTFTIHLSENLNTHGLGDSYDDNFDIYTNGGRIAEGFYDREKHSITYYFTDYVDSVGVSDVLMDIHLFVDINNFRLNGAMEGPMDYSLRIKESDSEQKGRITVNYRTSVDDQGNDSFYFMDDRNYGLGLVSQFSEYHPGLDETGEIVAEADPTDFTQIIYIKADDYFKNTEFFYSDTRNLPYEPSDFELYKVPDGVTLPKSFGLDFDQLEKVTLTEGSNLSMNQDNASIFLGDVFAGDQYVIKVNAAIGDENRNPDFKFTANSSLEGQAYYHRDRWVYINRGNFIQFFTNTTMMDGQVIYTLANQKNHVELTKVNLQGDPIIETPKKATFKISKDDEPFIESMQLDDKGQLNFEGLAPGTYKVYETKAPEGYKETDLNTAVASFTIDPDTGDLTNSNQAKQNIFNHPNTINFAKRIVYDDGTTKAVGLGDAAFGLYKFDKEKISEGESPLLDQSLAFDKDNYLKINNENTLNEEDERIKGNFLSDKDGYINFEGVTFEPGNIYGIAEEKAPTGISLVNKNIIRIFEYTEDLEYVFYKRNERVDESAGLLPLLEVSNDDLDLKNFFNIRNRKAGYPKTGGRGTLAFLVSGFGLMFIGLHYLWRRRKRE